MNTIVITPPCKPSLLLEEKRYSLTRIITNLETYYGTIIDDDDPYLITFHDKITGLKPRIGKGSIVEILDVNVLFVKFDVSENPSISLNGRIHKLWYAVPANQRIKLETKGLANKDFLQPFHRVVVK
jgi:hypothetical protein